MFCEKCPLKNMSEREQILIFAEERAKDIGKRTAVMQREDPIPMTRAERRADSQWYTSQHQMFEEACEQGLLGELEIDGECLALVALREKYINLPGVDTIHGR